MAVTYLLSTEHNNYPNFTVYDRFADGVAAGWRVNANEGYVFYDTNDEEVTEDPETGELVPITYYYTNIHYPRTFNWDNFSLVAVPRDSVPADQIFGGGNDHEVM